MSRLLDKKEKGKFPFAYTTSINTDVRKTFEQARAKLSEQEKKVTNIDKGRKR
jgi:hypothetical protein